MCFILYQSHTHTDYWPLPIRLQYAKTFIILILIPNTDHCTYGAILFKRPHTNHVTAARRNKKHSSVIRRITRRISHASEARITLLKCGRSLPLRSVQAEVWSKSRFVIRIKLLCGGHHISSWCARQRFVLPEQQATWIHITPPCKKKQSFRVVFPGVNPENVCPMKWKGNSEIRSEMILIRMFYWKSTRTLDALMTMHGQPSTHLVSVQREYTLY